MGLDSFIKVVDLKDVIDDFFFSTKHGEETEFKYWRKHKPLHDWMRRLFVKKGGDPLVNQFNCEYVRVTIEDLEFLKNDMDWHDEYGDSYDHEYNDFKFIDEAISFLKRNPDKAMYFYSWY
jgi:hypothetical protein